MTDELGLLTPEQLRFQLSNYSTQPRDLVVAQLPAGSTQEQARAIGQALQPWAEERNVALLLVVGQLDVHLLRDEDLARLGLQRTEPGLDPNSGEIL